MQCHLSKESPEEENCARGWAEQRAAAYGWEQSVTCQCVTLLGPTSGYLYDEILLAAMIEARIRPDAADS